MLHLCLQSDKEDGIHPSKGSHMKHFVLFSVLALASSQSFARRCVPEAIVSTRCDVVVSSTTVSECHIIRSQNNFPETFKPGYHVHPWNRSVVSSTTSSCDVDLQDCKDIAFRALEKFTYTNNCGDVYVGKSVEFSFQNLNADGSVATEVAGRFSK